MLDLRAGVEDVRTDSEQTKSHSWPRLRLRLPDTWGGTARRNPPRLAGEEQLIGLADPIDRALGGGLACGALHELAPTAPIHLGATSGFALAVAARASGGRR